jgi:hypothetical protein
MEAQITHGDVIGGSTPGGGGDWTYDSQNKIFYVLSGIKLKFVLIQKNVDAKYEVFFSLTEMKNNFLGHQLILRSLHHFILVIMINSFWPIIGLMS